MAIRSVLIRCAIASAALLACAATQAASTDDLLRMTDQLDQMDKLDFDQAIDRANKCTQARDFACTEVQLASARKVATGSGAKATLSKAESRLVAEKEAMEAERVALAKRQRELEEEERRLKIAEERAARQAAAQAEEDSGMSAAQGISLFGAVVGQVYQQQAAARLAEAANSRRIQQQLYASQADVARNQQRFAEERARLEAQRASLQRPGQQAAQAQPQQASSKTLAPAQSQAQLPAQSPTQSQVVAQNNARQIQLQRELDAAAAQRAQTTQAAQTAQATAQRLQADARSAATTPASTQLASNTSTTANNTAGQDSRIKLYGTMYVVHYAALKHSRSDKNNITLVEQITPVQWTYDAPRVSPLQQPSGRTDAVPYQVSDLLLKQMRPKFFDYLRGKYTICSEGGSTPDGCHGWSVYNQIGNSAAEVQGKLNTSLRSFSAPVTNDSGLDYPDSVDYRE